MPPVTLLSISSSNIDTKWKEVYASASINKKFSGIVAAGIYRGLLISEDPLSGDRTILIQSDSDTGDHLAVYENQLGYSMTYRDMSSGDITLSLASYASVNVVVCLVISYTTGSNTTAQLRGYTEAEYNALTAADRNELVVLGTVTVPASGAIAASSISFARRTLASSNISRGLIVKAPLVRNSDFEIGETNATYGRSSLFWDKSVSVGTADWRVSTVFANSGTKSIELGISVKPMTGEMTQQIGVPVSTDQIFQVSVSVKQLKTISSGTFVFFMEWGSASDALLSTVTLNLDGGGVDAAFRTVSTIFVAPAGATSLRSVGIRATALDPATIGVFAYIDNVEVFAEPVDAQNPYPFDQSFRRKVVSTEVGVSDASGTFASSSAAIRFDASLPVGEGRVVVEQSDPSDGAVALSPAGRIYKLGSGLLGSEANSLLPRVDADISVFAGVDFTLMWQSARSGESVGTYTQPVLRLYSSNDGRWVFTSNALWGGASWSKDVSGQSATKMTLAKDGLYLHTRTSSNNAPWNDSSWDDQTRLTNPLSSASDILIPRFSHGLSSGTNFTLISEYSFSSLKIRFYSYSGGVADFSIMATMNAYWDGTNWNRDTSATGASRLLMSMSLPPSGGSSWKYQFIDATATATWTEATFNLSANTQASIDKNGVHFSDSKRIFCTVRESFSNNSVQFTKPDVNIPPPSNFNQAYWNIAAGSAGTDYIWFPVPELRVGSIITEYRVIIEKNDTGGTMSAALYDYRDSSEALISAGSTSQDLSIPGYTAGYYRFGELGLSAQVDGEQQNLLLPFKLNQRPSQYYVRVRPSATATGGSDRIFGVMFTITDSY